MFALMLAMLFAQLNLEDPAVVIDVIAKAADSGNVVLATAGCVFLLVLGVRFFGAQFGGKVGAWFNTARGGAIVTLVIGVLGGIVTGLSLGKPITIGLVLSSLASAFAASGGRSLLRNLLQRPESEGSGASSAGSGAPVDHGAAGKPTWP